MKTPEWIKPAVWGAVAGAVAMTVGGFAVGGWVTGGTAEKMAVARAETAVVQVYTPVCVAKASLQPDQLALLKKTSSWQRDSFVVKAGWVADVDQLYRGEVAETCAAKAVEAMDAAAAVAKTG